MRNGFVPNETPWVDRILSQSMDRIMRVAPREALPILVPGEDAVFEEYGCGHYGCVLPTSRPDVVIKLTTDQTEAEFVSLILGDPNFEDIDLQGLVRYYALVRLKGVKHKGKPVYAIWREAANDVGFASVLYQQARHPWVGLLLRFLELAHNIRFYINPPKSGWKKRRAKVLELRDRAEMVSDSDPKWLKNPLKSAVSLIQATYAAQEMSSTQISYLVGLTLWELLESGVLLADVHTQNIGKVIRTDYGDEPIVVITDPGHMVILDPDLVIPDIPVA